jgi:hypothetical protein
VTVVCRGFGEEALAEDRTVGTISASLSVHGTFDVARLAREMIKVIFDPVIVCKIKKTSAKHP